MKQVVKYNNQIRQYKCADYEIWFDNEIKLDYVRLRLEGAKKVSAKYRKKYDINIHCSSVKLVNRDQHFTDNTIAFDDLFPINADNVPNSLASNIVKAVENLKKSKSQSAEGLFHLAINKNGDVMHAIPFSLIKANDGSIVLLDFENRYQNKDLKALGVDHVIGVSNYRAIGDDSADKGKSQQNDNHSCTVFAMNTLKNCAIDKKLIDQIAKNPQAKIVALNKMILGQNSNTIGGLNKEKSDKYVRKNDDKKDVNLKAFRKGFDYIEIPNSSNLEESASFRLMINTLSDNTKNKLKSIDEARLNYKDYLLLSPQLNSKFAKKFDQSLGDNSIKQLKFYHPNAVVEVDDDRFDFSTSRENIISRQVGQDGNQSSKTILSILGDALQEVNGAMKVKFDIKSAALVALLAVRNGGVGNATEALERDLKKLGYNDEDNNKSLTQFIKFAKKLSATFQKKCQEGQIYTGNQNANNHLTGMRMKRMGNISDIFKDDAETKKSIRIVCEKLDAPNQTEVVGPAAQALGGRTTHIP